MILLDTHALIWLHRGHRRARPLDRIPRLYVSPATVLELQFLLEAGRIDLRPGFTIPDLAKDARVALDDPPAAAWFRHALDLGYTRDPFDRLLAAHAILRGWKLATGDEQLLVHLDRASRLEL